jgi:inner membrane protein
MDNLTHSLVGALLGQMGLKRKTGLAMPALIIGANIPDIDAGCTVLGTVSLAMRRGLTHGPIAMLVLPLALTGALLWYDRWQERRGKRPVTRLPVRSGWLLALAFLGCLSHPFFDWLNSYGVRLLEPFSQRWFYGDALFIVDPWLWAMLIAGVWLSRRRDKAGRADWRRPAWAAFAGVAAYVGLNLVISATATFHYDEPSDVVANPLPLAFWQRDLLWRDDGRMRRNPPPERFGTARFSLFRDGWSSYREIGPTHMDDPRIAERAARNAEARAFLFWSRMPIAEVRGDTIILRDQRFLNMPTAGNFEVELAPK